MKITPLVYGRTTLPESMIFKGGSTANVRPILLQLFLIETEDRRILVDAGCVTMPGYVVEDFIGPAAALRRIGLSPLDITDLVLTHRHHDHVECTAEFAHATVYVQVSELAETKKYIPDEMKLVTFDDFFDICRGVRAVKIGGHTEGSCVVEVVDGENKLVFVGDECYMRECINKGILTGVSSSEENSARFMKKYSNGEYVLYFSHDL